MLARPCHCRNPHVFAHHDTCHRCGHTAITATASTRRIAAAIAEVALGIRTLGDRRGGQEHLAHPPMR